MHSAAPIRATYPAHLILLDLVTVIILDEEPTFHIHTEPQTKLILFILIVMSLDNIQEDNKFGPE
jgi:hypothetical protein